MIQLFDKKFENYPPETRKAMKELMKNGGFDEDTTIEVYNMPAAHFGKSQLFDKIIAIGKRAINKIGPEKADDQVCYILRFLSANGVITEEDEDQCWDRYLTETDSTIPSPNANKQSDTVVNIEDTIRFLVNNRSTVTKAEVFERSRAVKDYLLSIDPVGFYAPIEYGKYLGMLEFNGVIDRQEVNTLKDELLAAKN